MFSNSHILSSSQRCLQNVAKLATFQGGLGQGTRSSHYTAAAATTHPERNLTTRDTLALLIFVWFKQVLI